MSRSATSATTFASLLVGAACAAPNVLDDLPRDSATSGGSGRFQIASTNGGSTSGGSSASTSSGGSSSQPRAFGGAASGGGRGGSSAGSDEARSPSGGFANPGKSASGGSQPSSESTSSKAGNGSSSEVPSGGGAGGSSDEPVDTGGAPDSAGASGKSSEPPRSPPFFSEYLEGLSSDKALEIVAPEATSLSGCSVRVHSNGSLRASHTIELTESVSWSAPLVICTEKLAATATALGLDSACGRIEALSFNGNDAVLLVCDEKIADAIGRLGEDPGDRWGTQELGTLDLTLRRDCATFRGDPDASDAFDPASGHWSAENVGQLDDLGSHCAVLPP